MSEISISQDALAEAVLARAKPGMRTIIAVAGPPGSGKSTLADHLCELLNSRQAGLAAVLPMDGYHYDDLLLLPRGLRSRKGAPETFDVPGFKHMLSRLKANDEPEIAVPVFDRSLEIARAGARMIEQSVSILIVEGNYVLLDEPGWRDLHPHYDMTVMIKEPETVLRARLENRWQAMAPKDRAEKIDGNDLPNGRRIMAGSIKADYVLTAP